MSLAATIVWFRQDLRLADNPSLTHAVSLGGPVIPVFVWAPDEEGDWQPGAASRWWLHESLAALQTDLRKRGSNLIYRKGGTLGALKAIAKQTGATRVVWNRRYEPHAISRDKKTEEALRSLGLACESFNGSLLFEPWEIQNKSGRPFQIFTPFWRTCLSKLEPSEPLPPPRRIPSPNEWCCALELPKLELEPRIDWAGGLRDHWKPGENGARLRLREFIRNAIENYGSDRNRPDIHGTSRLSPHLHFGEISPRTIQKELRRAMESRSIGVAGEPDKPSSRSQAISGTDAFLRELGWREFASHLLYHFPRSASDPLRPEFVDWPWRTDMKDLKAWQTGQTGYPIVDAGMRELWHTGWMHNRVRMIVASFLVKDLLIAWQHGAKWFWDTLVDADLANNTLGWQWTAGCGADAAPYFRVFNPVTQGEKFDPDGDYVRTWVPELARIPAAWIHKPWAAPAGVLADANVRLGDTYPHPIVDHAEARLRALAAFDSIRTQLR